YGTEGAKSRIFATTDRARGTLKTLANQNGYETFVIPDDVGGRYSVLTACGLLPIAVAGIDIDAMMRGAADAASHFTSLDLSRNLCYRYAAMRNILHRGGKTTEVLVGFEPEFAMMGEWFKQLYGESEGKEGKGIWPCAAIFSTDLHSLGQFIQQGTPGIFETVVWVRNPKSDFIVRQTPDNSDGLNYLAGKKMSFINEMAMLGTMQAHNEGNVPGLIINLDTMEEYDLGYLFYFFEKACAISGYLLGINPFDQPGVEFYKKNMFKLLGKPNIK
ncbi:MAG: glucose-6-phosphate isomerase, partial [Clostridia bacterium]|nr:glucose-6-phosphate isomerase [Clostridia bacterium]